MLIVVQGKLLVMDTITASTSTDHSEDDGEKDHHLGDGDFCGEELVAWTLDDHSSSNLPVSTSTIQALTNVEAFGLMADDLKNVFVEQRVSSSAELNLNHQPTVARRLPPLRRNPAKVYPGN